MSESMCCIALRLYMQAARWRVALLFHEESWHGCGRIPSWFYAIAEAPGVANDVSPILLAHALLTPYEAGSFASFGSHCPRRHTSGAGPVKVPPSCLDGLTGHWAPSPFPQRGHRYPGRLPRAVARSLLKLERVLARSRDGATAWGLGCSNESNGNDDPSSQRLCASAGTDPVVSPADSNPDPPGPAPHPLACTAAHLKFVNG